LLSLAAGDTVMALSEIEVARVRKALDAFMARRRPPAHIRDQLDLGSRISGQSVEIFEIRPAWRGKPGEKRESPVAKTTFVRSRKVWPVFRMRQDLKWHGYEPSLEVGSIEEFCALVDEDACACFFG
jgi:hypothetical protein